MKKFLSLIIAVMFGLVLNAQTSKPEAADFTSFDSYGNEIHLFDILEGGQYVLLHLTIEGGEDTPIVTPPMVEAYKALGCNQHDVFFIGVNANGTANSTQEFIEEYGIEYPMIHNDNNTGSNTAVSIWQYYVCPVPTTILIAPDKSIVLNDIYPIEEAATVINALAEFGIQEYECGEEPEEVGTSVIDLFKVYPNPASDYIYITSEINGEAEVNIFDMTGRCVKNTHINDMNNATINISDIEEGIYFVNINGKVMKLIVE